MSLESNLLEHINSKIYFRSGENLENIFLEKLYYKLLSKAGFLEENIEHEIDFDYLFRFKDLPKGIEINLFLPGMPFFDYLDGKSDKRIGIEWSEIFKKYIMEVENKTPKFHAIVEFHSPGENYTFENENFEIFYSTISIFKKIHENPKYSFSDYEIIDSLTWKFKTFISGNTYSQIFPKIFDLTQLVKNEI